MKLPSNCAFFRSTPGSTSLGPAYTSALASTGQALEFLASSDRSAFVKSVNSVAQALQDSVSDMQKSGSKRATCVQHPLPPNIFLCSKILRDCSQLLRLPSAASDALTLISFCAAFYLSFYSVALSTTVFSLYAPTLPLHSCFNRAVY